jgi:cytochrome c
MDGGSGVWGQIPMAPHPTLSEPDAEAMVKYILTIK